MGHRLRAVRAFAPAACVGSLTACATALPPAMTVATPATAARAGGTAVVLVRPASICDTKMATPSSSTNKDISSPTWRPRRAVVVHVNAGTHVFYAWDDVDLLVDREARKLQPRRRRSRHGRRSQGTEYVAAPRPDDWLRLHLHRGANLGGYDRRATGRRFGEGPPIVAWGDEGDRRRRPCWAGRVELAPGAPGDVPRAGREEAPPDRGERCPSGEREGAGRGEVLRTGGGGSRRHPIGVKAREAIGGLQASPSLPTTTTICEIPPPCYDPSREDPRRRRPASRDHARENRDRARGAPWLARARETDRDSLFHVRSEHLVQPEVPSTDTVGAEEGGSALSRRAPWPTQR